MAKITEQIQSNATPLLVLALVVGAFFIGRLSGQVELLKNGTGTTPAVVAQPTAAQPDAAPKVELATIKDLFKKDLIKFGDANKKVIFVEVSDPSCPYCHLAAGKNKTLSDSDSRFKLKENGGTYVSPVVEMKKLLDQNKIGYVWIYSNGHGNGELASKALYCANEKGKFWAAHDLLFSAEGYDLINNKVKNDVAQSDTMATFLAKAVDVNFMKDCLSKDKYKARLAADMAIASSLGVNGTPGFYVNTNLYPGAVSYEDIKGVVEAAMK